jgi:hypothetical protein
MGRCQVGVKMRLGTSGIIVGRVGLETTPFVEKFIAFRPVAALTWCGSFLRLLNDGWVFTK